MNLILKLFVFIFGLLILTNSFNGNSNKMTYILSATPNACQISPGQTHCESRLKWSGGNDSTKLWYVLVSTGESGVVGSGPSGDQMITWIDTRLLRFELREEADIKASVLVQGFPAHSYYHFNGGSNLLVWKLDWEGSGFDGRSNHGLVFNYHKPEVRAAAKIWMNQMYIQGQRSVRVAVPIANRDAQDGYTFDVSFGNLNYQATTNLWNVLKDLKDIGYTRFIVAIFAFDELSPYNWDRAKIPSGLEQQRLSQIYSNAVTNIHDVTNSVIRPNIGPIPAFENQTHYWIDLGNEMAPGDPEKSYAIPYLKRIWNHYVETFGSDSTIGFSIAADSVHSVDRLRNLYSVYCDSVGCPAIPSAIDLHIYGELNSEALRTNEYDIFVAFHKEISKIPPLSGLPWIIGECYYNDKEVADHFSKASRDTGRSILFLAPWPLPRDRKTASCPPGVPDKSCAVPLPYDIRAMD